jgi:IclR family acetate operon transcriptional repressor
MGSIDIRERIHPVLVGLAHSSGETTVLGTLTEQRNAARVIDRVEGNEYLRISLEIGHTWPLHAGALAKALLATMPDRAHVVEQPLPRLCKNTLTDPDELLEELDAIRLRGWAKSIQETEIAAWGVAAAVPDRTGAPIASIGLISPLDRLSPEHEARLVELLQAAIEAVRSRLGLEDRCAPETRSKGAQR